MVVIEPGGQTSRLLHLPQTSKIPDMDQLAYDAIAGNLTRLNLNGLVAGTYLVSQTVDLGDTVPVAFHGQFSMSSDTKTMLSLIQ